MSEIDLHNPKWTIEINDHTLEEIARLIEKFPYAINFVNDQTEQLIAIALSENPRVIQFIRNQTVAHQRYAVNVNKYSVDAISNLDDELAIELINDDPEIIHSINNPSALIKSIAGILK